MGNCLDAMSNTAGGNNSNTQNAAKRRPKTARFASGKGNDLAPAKSAPVKKAPGNGAYLIYDTGSEGVWIVKWSEEPVEGALAYFKPGKTVPAFKYNQNDGRSVLMNVRGNKKKYMEGIMQFIKLAVDFKGEVYMYDNDDAEIVFINQEGSIVHIDHAEWFDAGDISVLAVMPRYSQVFKGLKSVLKEAFLDKASANRGVTWAPRPKTIKLTNGM